MMKNMKSYIALFFCLSIMACSQKVTSVYYYDNTKVDDGEIFGESLERFFTRDENIHVYKVRSNKLEEELQKIKDSASAIPPSQELDDGYYGYAFITPSKDTLFAGYQLNYWKYRRNIISYSNDNLKSLINSKALK